MNVITQILDIIYNISQFFMPIFIFVLVFNAGMTDHPKTIWQTIKENYPFYLKLVVFANIILPILVALVVNFLPMDPVYASGAIILFLTSGASTIIAFVELTGEELKYAVASMLLLTLMTVVVVPILLPILISGASISPLDLVSNMVTSILIPLLIGMGIRTFASSWADKIRPYSQFIQKHSMNIAIYGMMIGLLPDVISMIGSGILVTGTLLHLLGFFVAYAMEYNSDNRAKQYTAAFTGGQRNGAVAFTIALSNFNNNQLTLTVAVLAAIGSIMFTQISKYIGNRNESQTE